MRSNLHGAFAEIFFALNDDGFPNIQKTKDHVRYLLDNDVKGLFVGGVAAEGFTFTVEERLNWLKATVDEANGKAPVMFNISSININEVVETARKAVDIGSDMISITQPTPVLFGENEIMQYYKEISDRVEAPIMLYNESAIGNPLKIDLVKRIFSSFENFKYYKDSTHNLIDLHSLLSIDKPPRVLAGSDGLIYDITVSGGCGIVSLIIDVFPKIIIGIVDSLEKGNLKKALQQQRFILQVRSVLKAGGLTSGYRYASGLLGIELGNPRIPYSTLSKENEITIKNGLKNLRLI
ncbi:MAG: dihydrodipicolinate synthase family protein [Thermoplasmata archaeon]